MATLSLDVALPLRSFELAVSLEVSRTLALVGPSGAGKTSVLRVVAGLAPGRVVYDGEDWTRLPPERRRVGFVFQDYALFPHMTVRANVAYGGPVRDLLERLGIAHLADARPRRLSGGERQRVAIARAMINRPAMLLCDEPTGNLDSKTADVVADLLLSLTRETIVIGVTHSEHLAGRFGRRMSMRDGELVAE